MTAMLFGPHDPDAPLDPPAWLVAVEQKGRQSLARILGGPGDEDEMPGLLRAGDEPFAATNDVAVTLAGGDGLDHGRIRPAARMRLGHDE